MLLRINKCGVRVLSAINGPYNCEKLKNVVGQGKIYMTPLQRDLIMEPLPTNDKQKVRMTFRIFKGKNGKKKEKASCPGSYY